MEQLFIYENMYAAQIQRVELKPYGTKSDSGIMPSIHHKTNQASQILTIDILNLANLRPAA
jgi:hypothetical protein